MTSFASGPSGRYAYGSWTPKDARRTGAGHARHADRKRRRRPRAARGHRLGAAVLLVHGSGGVYKALYEFWAKRLNDAGIAVFTIDMFGPRGVASTAEDQSQVPFAADVADVFGALRLLATHLRIDARRIAVMGFSRGGTAAVRAAAEKVIAGQKLPDGLRFAARVPCTAAVARACSGWWSSRAPSRSRRCCSCTAAPTTYRRSSRASRLRRTHRRGRHAVEFVTLEGARHQFDGDDLLASRTPPIGQDARTARSRSTSTFHVYDRRNGSRLRGAAEVEELPDPWRLESAASARATRPRKRWSRS